MGATALSLLAPLVVISLFAKLQVNARKLIARGQDALRSRVPLPLPARTKAFAKLAASTPLAERTVFNLTVWSAVSIPPARQVKFVHKQLVMPKDARQ